MSTWECISCSASCTDSAYCHACGAAKPAAGLDDSSLSMVLGLVCTACDTYNEPSTVSCSACGTALDVPAHELSGKSTSVASDPFIAAPTSVYTPPSVTLTPQSAAQPAVPAPLQMPPPPTTLPPPSPLRTPLQTPVLAPILGPQPGYAHPPSLPGVEPPKWMQAPTPNRGVARDDAGGDYPALEPLRPASPSLSIGSGDTKPCVRCQTPLARSDRFCRSCGAKAPDIVGVAPNKNPAGITHVGLFAGPASTAPVAPARPQGAASTMVFGAITSTERFAKLSLVRGHATTQTQWRITVGETLIGRNAVHIAFPTDTTLSTVHLRLRLTPTDLLAEPLVSTNGVFLRIREPVQLARHSEFVVGAQRMRVLDSLDLPEAPTSKQRPASASDPNIREPGTQFLGSMVKGLPPISLLHIARDDRENQIFHRYQRVLTLGRSACDVNFAGDSFVSERHAQLTLDERSGLLLEDLRSRNGTYVRLTAPTRLAHGDLLLLGDKVLRVELPR